MSKPFKVTILTLFPEMFPGMLAHSIMGRGQEKGLWELEVMNIRDFALPDKHKTVDDTPYGGGAGMVMRPDVVAAAIRAAKEKNVGAKVVYMSASGRKFDQEMALDFAKNENGLIVLCGHYEGIDQRVLDAEVDAEVCIGDYVLSGGEAAAVPFVDAVVRLIPDVLGAVGSLNEESFDLVDEDGNKLVEYPHYTRPETWEGQEVPQVLKSGHHANIEKWRMDEAKRRTKERRADLVG